MNRLLIDGSICWETNKTTVNEAVDELFEAIGKSGLPLDIFIESFAELRDVNYNLIDG